MTSQDSSAENTRSRRRLDRKGKIAIMTGILLVPLFGFAALAVDATYLMKVKKEAEIAAESAALAGVFGLTHPDRMLVPPDMTRPIAQARDFAVAYAAKHRVGEVPSVVIDRNNSNAYEGDVYIGRLRTWSYQNYPWDDSNPVFFNSVRVRVKRTAERNGPVGLFFANVFGTSSAPLEAVATARLEIGVVLGFSPTETQNSLLMPFAVCGVDWDEAIEGIDPTPDDGVPAQLGPDQYAWVTADASGNQVSPFVARGADSIPELLMYPQNQGGGDRSLPSSNCSVNGDSGGVTPGNFGTVDIGHSGNSTSDLIRQILYGISKADFDYMAAQGIDMQLSDYNPDFDLNGDTGISAGMKSALESVIGKCRTVVIYASVTTNGGNNAQFTVVRYQTMRIMEVKLTGFPKYIRIQPAICQDGTAIIDQDQTGPNLVFHPPRLIE